jgi:uncharacterized membrane protein
VSEIFAEYGSIIIFLHIISAVIWVGGMIAIKFAVHPAMQLIATPEVRVSRSLHITKNLFHLVVPAIFFLVLTGIIMTLALHRGDPLTHVKEAIWTIMLINFVVMYFRRNRAEQHSRKGEVAEAKKIANIITKYMLPVNIVLGIVAIYVGGLLRGF